MTCHNLVLWTSCRQGPEGSQTQKGGAAPSIPHTNKQSPCGLHVFMPYGQANLPLQHRLLPWYDLNRRTLSGKLPPLAKSSACPQ